MRSLRFVLLVWISLSGCSELARRSEAQVALHATKVEEYLRVHPERRQPLVIALNSGTLSDAVTWRELSLVYSAPRPVRTRPLAVFWCGPDTEQRTSPLDDCPNARGILFLTNVSAELIERRGELFDRSLVADAGRPGDGRLIMMKNDPHLTYTVAQAMLSRRLVLNMTYAEIDVMQLRRDGKEKYWCNFSPAAACTNACGFCSIVTFINGNTIYLDNKPSLGIPRVRRIEPFINALPIP